MIEWDKDDSNTNINTKKAIKFLRRLIDSEFIFTYSDVNICSVFSKKTWCKTSWIEHDKELPTFFIFLVHYLLSITSLFAIIIIHIETIFGIINSKFLSFIIHIWFYNFNISWIIISVLVSTKAHNGIGQSLNSFSFSFLELFESFILDSVFPNWMKGLNGWPLSEFSGGCSFFEFSGVCWFSEFLGVCWFSGFLGICWFSGFSGGCWFSGSSGRVSSPWLLLFSRLVCEKLNRFVDIFLIILTNKRCSFSKIFDLWPIEQSATLSLRFSA